jgi:hypothetical protein
VTYTVVEGFPGGVDRSRPIYAAGTGTLWSGINGHLTRGGDFEPRKAFVKVKTLPAGTFGLSKSGTDLLVFASTVVAPPSGVVVQQLTHPDGVAMSRLLSVDLFRSKAYTIAEYSDGSVHHFYDGAIVQDWVSGVARSAMTNNSGIAAHLAALIDADAAYVATSVGNVITIEAAVAGTPFTISSYTANVEGGADDQTITMALVTSNVPGVAETVATGSFQITGGTLSAGVNKITSVKVNGIEILNVAVDWGTSHSATASAVATQINAYGSTPEYTASFNGATVIISAAAASGTSPNGFTVAVTVGGDVTVGSIVNMAGGVAAVSGVKQKYTATISGAFNPGDRFGITIDAKKFGAEGNPSTRATVARTHQRKVYAGGKLLEFSGADTPAGWNRDIYAGAGFIDPASQDSDADAVTGIGKYLNYLAVATENSIQVWFVDVDDAANTLVQYIGEIGTRSPKTMRNYGTLDLFMLSQSGIRSIRSRAQINLAGVNDVGTPIDSVVKAQLDALTEAQVRECASIVEPEDGRFWLTVGDKVFVFSYFPTKKVSGWTWYEPGVFFTDFVVIDRKVYCRAGDDIYVYGGMDGNTYETCDQECRLPFYSFGKPGHTKGLVGLDISATGEWDVDVFVDPNDADGARERIGLMSGVTYGLENIAAVTSATHFSVRLKRTAASSALVSNICTYYTPGSAEG